MWTIIFIAWTLYGIGGAVIALMKDRHALEGFGLGVALGIIGIGIECALPKGMPTAPEGTFAEQCDYCNAIQNVSIAKPEYECWQCGTVKKFRLVD